MGCIGLGWLAASVAVHTVYHFALPRAYQHGEFGVVYPVARGSAPLFVTLGAALLAGEWPGATGLAGVLCLSLGVLALSLRSGAASGYGGSGYALATGAMIACYTVIDGWVRAHPAPRCSMRPCSRWAMAWPRC